MRPSIGYVAASEDNLGATDVVGWYVNSTDGFPLTHRDGSCLGTRIGPFATDEAAQWFLDWELEDEEIGLRQPVNNMTECEWCSACGCGHYGACPQLLPVASEEA